MSRFKVEYRIILYSALIVGAVIALGYLAYNSLSQIVDTVHNSAKPDQKLVLVKTINSELLELENDARIYVLTSNDALLVNFKNLNNSIQTHLRQIQEIGDTSVFVNLEIIDSISDWSNQKINIWNQIIHLYCSENQIQESFSDIYASFEKTELDTIAIEKKQKGFLKSIFSKKDTTNQIKVVEKPIDRSVLKDEIEGIQEILFEQSRQLKLKEAELIRKNLEYSNSLNNLVVELENREQNLLVRKTVEADQLASQTYDRLIIFSIAAVIMLVFLLYSFWGYMRKSHQYQAALKFCKRKC